MYYKSYRACIDTRKVCVRRIKDSQCCTLVQEKPTHGTITNDTYETYSWPYHLTAEIKQSAQYMQQIFICRNVNIPNGCLMFCYFLGHLITWKLVSQLLPSDVMWCAYARIRYYLHIYSHHTEQLWQSASNYRGMSSSGNTSAMSNHSDDKRMTADGSTVLFRLSSDIC